MIIDVSYANGQIDWSKASQKVDGAIIRAGFGREISQKDAQFENNIAGALENGLQVGFYWFSYAESIETAFVEAKVCEQIIEKYKNDCTLGVFFDWEYASANYCAKEFGNRPKYKVVQEMTTAFIEYFQHKGWKAGYYANMDFSRTYYSGYNAPADSLLWLAYYSKNKPNVYCNYQQYSSTGTVNGISTNVDLNRVINDPETLTAHCIGDGVRIRSRPATDGKILGYLYVGDEVKLLADDGWGWSKCNYKGITGWVYNDYLNGPNLSPSKTVLINGTNVNVRSSPYLNGEIITQANKGDTFTLCSILRNGWLDVNIGYIYYDKSYITIK